MAVTRAGSMEKPARQIKLQVKRGELSDRRGAGRPVQGKGIVRRGVLRGGGKPNNRGRRNGKSQARRGHRRHVQRLADVANRVRAALMLVQERAAAREVQQRRARKER
jgi:hypothetical protein